MPKTRCRRCRKARKFIHPDWQVCASCAEELIELRYDLQLIEGWRHRVAAQFRDEWVG